MQFYSRNITNLSLSTDVYRPIMYWNMPFPVLIGFHTQIHYTTQHRKKEKCGVVLKEKHTKDFTTTKISPSSLFNWSTHSSTPFSCSVAPSCIVDTPVASPESLMHPLHRLCRWYIRWIPLFWVADASVANWEGMSWSWSYGSWNYNYLCNQCLSPLKLWVRTPPRRDVLDATLCDKACEWLAGSRWFSPGFAVSSTIKTNRNDIAEMLLKVTLNTITLTLTQLRK